MRSGKKLCYALAAEDFDLKSLNSATEFPFDVLFDWEKGREHDNYFKIVKDSEKFDHISGTVDGRFYMQEKFGAIILTTTADQDVLKKIVESLPHDKLAKFVIDA